jgi:hypothetical protein
VALQNYGHFAEAGLVGEKLFGALSWTCRFTQQFSPYTTLPFADNYYNYGPSQLAALEYIADLYGVQIDEDTLYWSGLARGNHTQVYTQIWGTNQYRISTGSGTVHGSINSSEVFSCTPGVRVVTDMAGSVVRVIGTDTVSARSVTLNAGGSVYTFTVHPNEVFERSGNAFVSVKQVPYDYDPRVPVGKPWGPVVAERWSSHAIRVHWMERFTNQTSFVVQRADDSAFTLNTVSYNTPGSDSCFIDNTVTAGRTYYYRVKAQGPSGESGYSYVTKAMAQDPYLSDFDWFVLRSGANVFHRDSSYDRVTMHLNGISFSKGVSVSPPARMVYDLGGLYSRFTAQVGVDDEVGAHGTVTFSVLLDGDTTPAFASGLMIGGATRKAVDLDLTGRRQMTLIVTDGGDNSNWDHADWADAKLTGAIMSTGLVRQPASLTSATPRMRAPGPDGVLAITGLGRAAWTVRIVDAAGRVVASRKIIGQESVSVVTGRLAVGMYLVRLEGPRVVSVRVVATGL